MFEFLPLGFGAPGVLLAAAALPALWILLRVTPPRAKRIVFPAARIAAGLTPRRRTPVRTPWWLLLLRMAVLASIVGAMAAPVWDPVRRLTGHGPLVLAVDDGWTAAADWDVRAAAASDLLLSAASAGRPVALLPLSAEGDVSFSDAGSAAEKLRAMRPTGWRAPRASKASLLARLLEDNPGAEIAWISDGIAGEGDAGFMDVLRNHARAGGAVSAFAPARPRVLSLAGLRAGPSGYSVQVVRADATVAESGEIRALDRRGTVLAEERFILAPGARSADAKFDLPLEIRNDIWRFEIAGHPSAGAVALVDSSSRRRRVAIVSGGSADTAQPLLAPSWFLTHALSSFAEVREPKDGPGEAASRSIGEGASVLVLADPGKLPPAVRDQVADFVDKGGVLVRFAGPKLAGDGDDGLLPVKLRVGGRTLGSSLSWEKPMGISAPDAGPFAGMVPDTDTVVTRQLLAEPSADLSKKTWAALTDGTPVVTADRRGKGTIVLFHVSADTTWSNLPLSKLFVDMLRRIVDLSLASDGGTIRSGTAAPFKLLDGRGVLHAPEATAKAIVLPDVPGPAAEHPPGFYGRPDAPSALNAGVAVLTPLALPDGVSPGELERAPATDLRPWLLALAALLFGADGALSLRLTGAKIGRAAAVAALALIGAHSPDTARAQDLRSGNVRLAYVASGDPSVDRVTVAGLAALSGTLAGRTAIVPGPPVAVDPEKDDLSVFPVVYWPVTASSRAPSRAAAGKIDLYMRTGGLVVLDTRDALVPKTGDAGTRETRALRAILAEVSVPSLARLPSDHVLLRSFYLLDGIVGRYAEGETWIESVGAADDEVPARAGDGVSPLIITDVDLAGAWADGPDGNALLPLSPGGPKQRETALRSGVNIMLYALTGNYKADQVHVPALLERLGK